MSLKNKPWLIAAVPTIGVIWFALAAANYYTGASYGSEREVARFGKYVLTTAMVFGLVSLAADILGTVATFAARSNWKQRLKTPFVISAVIGAMCVGWSFHSAHRFIKINLLEAELPAVADARVSNSIEKELIAAESRLEQLRWSEIPKREADRDRRNLSIKEAADDVAAARNRTSTHKAVKSVEPLKGLELAFAFFMVFVSMFAPLAFLSSPDAAPAKRDDAEETPPTQAQASGDLPLGVNGVANENADIAHSDDERDNAVFMPAPLATGRGQVIQFGSWPDELKTLDHLRVQKFFDDCTEPAADAKVNSKVFHDAFEVWCGQRQLKSFPLWKFAQICQQLGIPKKALRKTICYPGIQLRDVARSDGAVVELIAA